MREFLRGDVLAARRPRAQRARRSCCMAANRRRATRSSRCRPMISALVTFRGVAVIALALAILALARIEARRRRRATGRHCHRGPAPVPSSAGTTTSRTSKVSSAASGSAVPRGERCVGRGRRHLGLRQLTRWNLLCSTDIRGRVQSSARSRWKRRRGHARARAGGRAVARVQPARRHTAVPLGRFNLAHDALRSVCLRPAEAERLLGVALSQPGLSAFGRLSAVGAGRGSSTASPATTTAC